LPHDLERTERHEVVGGEHAVDARHGSDELGHGGPPAVALIVANTRAGDAAVAAGFRGLAEACRARRRRHGVGMALDRDDVAAFRVETVEKVASDAAGKRPVVGADEARAGDARGTADEAHEWDA